MLTTNISFSQDYMDDIALKTCECLNNLPDNLEQEKMQESLGFCLINAASRHKKKIKKDFKFDFNTMNAKQGEELGRAVGVKMATVCPDVLIQMTDMANNDVSESFIEGSITTIVDDKFVEFSIKDIKGKTSKYYWFTYIESSTDLSTDYKNLIDKNVQVTFLPQEFFDARIGEYRTLNVILKLEITEN